MVLSGEIMIYVGITGHRDVKSDTKQKLHEAVTSMVPVWGTEIHFVTGGAVGFDLIAAEYALEHGYRYTIILPFPFAIHTRFWSNNQRKRLEEVINKATEYLVLGYEYKPSSYFKRDKAIVDKSETVLCYHDGREKGGTWYTIKYARKKQKEILNCYG